MSYEVIEKNKYGVLVRDNIHNIDPCKFCKYISRCKNIPCNLRDASYYLTDQEAAKLETELLKISVSSEIQIIETSNSQKELIDLQIENKQLKERIASINEYLDNRISDSDYVIKNMKRDNLEYENIMEYKQCYQNVKEFIKNQK